MSILFEIDAVALALVTECRRYGGCIVIPRSIFVDVSEYMERDCGTEA